MNHTQTNEIAAFPSGEHPDMNLLDWFARIAMHNLAVTFSQSKARDEAYWDSIADLSYAAAHAMIKARNKIMRKEEL